MYYFQDIEICKKTMVERGNIFLQKVALSRKKIANYSHQFIRDGAVSYQMCSCLIPSKRKGKNNLILLL